ncbi:hypothetical protein EIP86_010698 [Pleurotus ostreatoroseus]|nr:hypothetical protein EIP86_010698 [Pleurotus ostreatoroseus]
MEGRYDGIGYEASLGTIGVSADVSAAGRADGGEIAYLDTASVGEHALGVVVLVGEEREDGEEEGGGDEEGEEGNVGKRKRLGQRQDMFPVGTESWAGVWFIRVLFDRSRPNIGAFRLRGVLQGRLGPDPISANTNWGAPVDNQKRGSTDARQTPTAGLDAHKSSPPSATSSTRAWAARTSPRSRSSPPSPLRRPAITRRDTRKFAATTSVRHDCAR